MCCAVLLFRSLCSVARTKQSSEGNVIAYPLLTQGQFLVNMGMPERLKRLIQVSNTWNKGRRHGAMAWHMARACRDVAMSCRVMGWHGM